MSKSIITYIYIVNLRIKLNLLQTQRASLFYACRIEIQTTLYTVYSDQNSE